MNDKLIESLMADLKPVKVVAKTGVVVFWGLLSCILVSFLLISFLSPIRESVLRLMIAPVYIWVEILSLLASVLLLIATMKSRIPGLDFKRTQIAGFAVFAIQIFGLIGFTYFNYSGTNANLINYVDGGLFCSLRVVMMSALSSLLIVSILRRALVTNRAQTTMICSVLGISFGLFVLPFFCESEDALHLLLSHLLIPSVFFVPIFMSFRNYLYDLKKSPNANK